MASIGSETFFSITGCIKGPGPKLEDITSPGVPGASFAIKQWRGDAVTIRALRLVYDLWDVPGYRLDFEYLEGEVVTVVDDWGDTRTGVLVHSGREVQVQEVVNSSEGVLGYMWWEFVVEELY